jgi:hypothetical protein
MAFTNPGTATTAARTCSLEGTARTERLREWEALRSKALISEHVTADMTVAVLKRSADVMRRLRALIDAERECCPFLRFRVTERDADITVEVTSTAAED